MVAFIIVSNTWLSGGHLMWSISPSEASAWKVASDWLRYARGSLLFMLYWHTVGVGRLGRREQEDHNNILISVLNITISYSGIVLPSLTIIILCWLPHSYWGLRIKGCEDRKRPGVRTTNSLSILWGWAAYKNQQINCPSVYLLGECNCSTKTYVDIFCTFSNTKVFSL